VLDGPFAWRTAAREDAAAVRTLTRAAYAKWLPVIGREPKPMGADYDVAVKEHRIDLLDLDGALVGLVEMVRAGDHLLIVNVAVAVDRQGKGLGHRLMARAEDIAAESGLAELRLYTHNMFADNIRLYQRLGYRIDREEKIADGAVVHMSKRIDDAQTE